ncbi:MAG: Holliday junction branch migration protein RuvA [Candidatus Paceibacterota bacterium]|jgi:Holliday junction DNA helicase RuvA
MIYSINGVVAALDPHVVVETVAGIGFRIYATQAVRSCARVGKPLRVVCYLYPESYDLYGFISEEERAFFELLISVSGVGPKIALKMLNAADAPALARMIASGKDGLLSRQCGVSARIASRVVIDLKNKVALQPSSGAGESDFSSDVFEALEALGYHKKDIARALSHPSVGGDTLEAVVKKVLAVLARSR